MLDGEETVEKACGELRREGARQHAGREETVEIACGQLRWEEARQHVDGQETVEIAYGELRWDGARQHAGRRGNRANSLRRASLGGSETACWTERKPWKKLAESFAGRERDSMLDGRKPEIACGELRWEGARQHADRTGNRANSLGRERCWTERKPCK